MSSSAPKKKKRENSKTRVWEKERRNRINDYFKKLWEVLPMYDASSPLSKPDILFHAASTIKELDEKLKTLLANSEGKIVPGEKLRISTDVIKKLQDRVKKLLLRNEQLAQLLNTAGIKIPSEYRIVKKLKTKYKYKNGITKEQQEKILQKEMEKENKIAATKLNSFKHRPKRKKPVDKKSARPGKKGLLSLSQNCVFVVSHANLQQNNSCFILSKSGGKSNQTVLTNSVLFKTPVVSTHVKTAIVPTQAQVPGFPSGTLVFANGAVMPVIPTPRPFPVVPTVLTNPLPAPLSTIIVVSSKNDTDTSDVGKSATPVKNASSKVLKTLAVLRPSKTNVTQVNKVPIPALTSKYNKYNFLADANTCIKKTQKSEQQKNCGNKSRKKNAGQGSENKAKKVKLATEENVKTACNDGVTAAKVGEVESVPTERQPSDQMSMASQSVATVEKKSDSDRSKDKTELAHFTNNVTREKEVMSHDVQNSDAHFEAESLKQSNSKPANSSENILLSSLNNTPLATETSESTEPEVTKLELNKSRDMQHTASKSVDINSCQKETGPELNSLHVEQSSDLKSLEMHLPQTELSNDIFASFHVPPGCQNQESTSPTAAFLLAFPLVSSGTKVAEVLGDENSESQTGTPNLLQIGTMDIAKPTQSYSESLTPNLLNFDSFSFFGPTKDSCAGFYSSGGKTMDVFSSSGNAAQLGSKNVQIKPDSSNGTTKLHVAKNLSYSSNKFPEYQQRTLQKDSSKGKIEDVLQGDDGLKPQCAKDSGYNSKFHNYSQVQKETTNNNAAKIQDVLQGSGSTVDISGDIFSFKPSGSDGYTNKNDGFIGKFQNHYTEYRNCSTSVNSCQFGSMNAVKQYAPVYTSATTGNTFYHTFGDDLSSSYTTEYSSRKSLANCNANMQHYQKEKPNNNLPSKAKPLTQHKPINWMTTPSTTASYKADSYFIPPLSSSTNAVSFTNTISSNNYFNTPTYTNSNEHFGHQDFRKTGDMYASYQRAETEDNQFSWSPTKMPQFLDTSHPFVPSTLPTLVGDLALNNTPAIEQKTYKIQRSSANRSRKSAGNCDQSGQSSFLSVSQLVEGNQEGAPAKVASRRNSGNRSKIANKNNKRTNGRAEAARDMHGGYQSQKSDKSGFATLTNSSNIFNEAKQPSRSNNNNSKNIRSSYSAEALIGIQEPTQRSASCQNSTKSLVPNFLNDNMYFPSIEVSQDNNSYMHTGQSYHQSNTPTFVQNFATTFHNNASYGNNFASTIASSYAPTNSFMSSTSTQEFLGDTQNLFPNNGASTKEKCNFPKNYYRQSEIKDDKGQAYNCKKPKKRSPNDNNVLAPFDIPFLSIPGAINSPVLPDDFHTTYLPPTTLYSCKNPLYTKPNSEAIANSLMPSLAPPIATGSRATIQHPQMSPSVNSAGTSLTNFNLSTIFPEINKGLVQESFTENRNKDYTPLSKAFVNTSSHHIGSFPI